MIPTARAPSSTHFSKRFLTWRAAVARFLHIPEHRLHESVRRGLVAPRTMRGRRLWTTDEVLIVARALGADSPAVRNALTAGAPKAQDEPPPARQDAVQLRRDDTNE